MLATKNRVMKGAVVGAGHIARQHLRCMVGMEDVDVVGVCDLSPSMAASAAEMLGVERWYVDYQEMLEVEKPEVVHVTTPAPTHFRLAMDALESGAHVLVEKPITTSFEELDELLAKADELGKVVVEDHNYLFNESVQEIVGMQDRGELGEVTHVEVSFCLNILGEGSRFTDPNLPHPALKYPGGAISDFLTHLSYLAWYFVGAHRGVRTLWRKRDEEGILESDEFRALVDGERGTALLNFSAHTQPDAFFVRVYGTEARAEAHLFEPRFTAERVRGGGPLMPILNARGVGKAEKKNARKAFFRKLGGGPGAYEGLWELLRRTYGAIAGEGESPVSREQIVEVNQLVSDLTKSENMF